MEKVGKTQKSAKLCSKFPIVQCQFSVSHMDAARVKFAVSLWLGTRSARETREASWRAKDLCANFSDKKKISL